MSEADSHLAEKHDCMSLYQYGETTPWTCPRCGQVWIPIAWHDAASSVPDADGPSW